MAVGGTPSSSAMETRPWASAAERSVATALMRRPSSTWMSGLSAGRCAMHQATVERSRGS